MTYNRGFLGDVSYRDEILWFIILFLLIFRRRGVCRDEYEYRVQETGLAIE